MISRSFPEFRHGYIIILFIAAVTQLQSQGVDDFIAYYPLDGDARDEVRVQINVDEQVS